MRTLDESLITAQESASRKPISKAIIYDSLLRFSEETDSFEDTGFFSSTISDTPVGFLDADIDAGDATVIWLSGTNLYKTTVSNVSDWETSSQTTYTTDSAHRASVFASDIFHYYDGEIKKNDATWKSIDAGNYAIAAASASDVYVAEFDESGPTLKLSYHTSSTVDELDYNIILPGDYNEIALGWFDVVRLADGTDVIMFNAESQGLPKIILRRNGVWGNVREMIPVDIVDNYSYLRVGWLRIYEGVIYATGELGRRGSTGRHPQSMGVVLRSKDGVHWTMDRFRYLGQTPCRSPLLSDNGYAYLIREGAIDKAPLTPLFGLQSGDINIDHVKIEVSSDIHNWNKKDTNHGQSGQLTLTLADTSNQYSSPSSSSLIKPGYMLELYAGYHYDGTDYYELMNTYQVDAISRQVAGSDVITLQCREWAYAQLKDVAFDQDWQWLSMNRLFDDCDQVDHMYGITGGILSLTQFGNDEKALLPADTISDEFGVVQFQTKNKNSIAQLTSPFEASDGEVSLVFKPTSSESFTYGGSFNPEMYGAGCGPSFVKDKDNAIISFYNIVDQELKIMELRDGETTVLDTTSCSDFDQESDTYYEVSLKKLGDQLRAVINQRTSGSTGIDYSHYLEVDCVMNTDAHGICASHGEFQSTPGFGVYSNFCFYKAAKYDDPVDGLWYIRLNTSYFDTFSRLESDPSTLAPTSPNLSDLYGKTAIVNGLESVTFGSKSTTGQSRSRVIYTKDSSFAHDDIVFDGSTVEIEYYNDGGEQLTSFLNRHSGKCVLATFDEELGDLSYRKVVSYKVTGVGGTYRLVITCDDTISQQDMLVLIPALRMSTTISSNTISTITYNSDGGTDLVNVCSFDIESDKSIDWIIKDIAAKAGILDFSNSENDSDTRKSISETVEATTVWLDDELPDFDLRFDLANAPSNTDVTTLYFGCDTKDTSPTIGAKLEITASTSTLTIDLYHTANGTWTKIKTDTFNYVSGQTYRIVKRGRSIAFYVEDRLAFTGMLRSIFGLSTDNYNSFVESGGYVGIDTDVSGSHTLWMYDLFALVGSDDSAGIIADQGNPAFKAIQSVIKDVRIKVLPTAEGHLKIDRFETRSDLGTVPDLVLGFSQQPTNRIPTHIRVIGAEIGEYFDHARAAEYGIIFHTIQAEALDEDESYDEAARVVLDALSYSNGIDTTLGAQLDWEVEDKVTFNMTTYDGEIVSMNGIVDSINTNFGLASLELNAKIRKLYES